jgi:hypothetical protein
MDDMDKKTFLFEHETCSRCGGSGRYSYCQRYGSTCFKCSGNQQVLTKRGYAAQALYNRLLSKPASALQPGMKIRDIGVTHGGDVFTAWYTIVAIKADNTLYNGQLREDYIQIEMTRKGSEELTNLACSLTSVYRVAATPQEKSAAADVCIAFERSLNKHGRTDKTLAKIAKQVAWA